MHPMEKPPRTAKAPLQIFIYLFILQAPPIKSAPAEAENPTVSAPERLLWLHGPILISLVVFLHHLWVYGGPIIEFSFCLLHYDSMQPVSPCLPPLLRLLCYPSLTNTRSISAAFQTDVTGNKIDPFSLSLFSFCILHFNHSHHSFLSSLLSALSCTLPLLLRMQGIYSQLTRGY